MINDPFSVNFSFFFVNQEAFMWNILIETFDNSYKAELCSMLTASFDDVILYSNNGTTAFPDSEKWIS